jgi:hypothetical protein
MPVLLVLHVLAVAIGAVVLWLYVFPTEPVFAVADSVIAGILAGYVEFMTAWLGWWNWD